MKNSKKYSQLFAATVLVTAAVAPVVASAEEASTNENIVISNNVTLKDTVVVKNVPAKAKVTIYKADGKTVLASKTASKAGDVTITISGGFSEKTIHVTVKEYLKAESEPVTVTVTDEVQSKLEAPNVKVTNNVDSKDVIEVTGLKAKDVITVKDTAGTVLKKVTAKKETESFEFGQLKGGDKITVTKTSVNEKESAALEVTLASEKQSEALKAENVVATDNLTGKDTVVVKGLTAKDVVTVYKKGTTDVLGKATAKGDTVTINTSELKDVTDVDVKVKKYNELESAAYTATVKAPTPTKVEELEVEATNVIKGKDTVTVTGVKAKDVVKVYVPGEGDDAEPVEIGKATAKNGTVVISTKELTGVVEVYVTVQTPGSLESETNVGKGTGYGVTHPEATSLEDVEVKATDIATGKDSIVVTGLAGTVKKTVYVYSDEEGKTLIGKAAVKASETSAAISPSIDLKDIETVYVAVENDGQLASSAATKEGATKFKEGTVEEPKQTEVDEIEGFDETKAINNIKGKDVVVVKGLSAKDSVEVYSDEEGKTLIGKGTAKAGEDLTISLSAQLSSEEDSVVYLKVTKLNQLASEMVEVEIEQPEKTTSTFEATAENNVTLADTVKVTGVAAKDIVTVYKKVVTGEGDTAEESYVSIGKATAKGSEVVINVTGKAAGFKDIIGEDDETGKVYVGVTSPNKLESEFVEATVTKEKASDALGEDAVVFTNNVAIKDVVTIKGLEAKDVVTLYTKDDAGEYKKFATTTAKKAGDLVWSLSSKLPEVAADADGEIYVTIKKVNELESDIEESAFEYAAEQVSSTEFLGEEGALVQVNNATGKDKVTIKGLKAKDVVTIYADDKKKKVLGKVTAKGELAAGHVVSLTLPEITEENSAPKIYVVVQQYNKLESEVVEVAVEAVPTSEFPGTSAE